MAALALLLWLFAAGAAMAHTCASHLEMDTDDCCVTMQAATVRADSVAEASVPAQTAQPWVAAAPLTQVVPPPAMQRVHRAAVPLWNDSGQRIHVVLLRLAL